MVFEWPKVVNVKIKAFLGGGRKGRGRNCVCVCGGVFVLRQGGRGVPYLNA